MNVGQNYQFSVTGLGSGNCVDYCIIWSTDGGDPASQTGGGYFTTHWDTPGEKTVYANTLCGWDSKTVTVCDPVCEFCCGGNCCSNTNQFCCDAGIYGARCCNSGKNCCTDWGPYCCDSNETCCDGICCASDECCGPGEYWGTCVKKCVPNGESCSWTYPGVQSGCQRRGPTDFRCIPGEVNMTCDWYVIETLHTYSAKCAACASDCKHRAGDCVKLKARLCREHAFVGCLCTLVDDAPTCLVGDYYECN